jgi:hypothetical protein
MNEWYPVKIPFFVTTVRPSRSERLNPKPDPPESKWRRRISAAAALERIR